MHMLDGDDRGSFTVRIVNDLCQERFMEYIQVHTMHVQYISLLS